MNSTGHMVLLQAAYSQMKPQTQAWLQKVLSDPDNPEDGGFQEPSDTTIPGAATEPDDYKSWARRTHNGDDPKSYLHFVNTPVGPGAANAKPASTPNGITQLESQEALVENPSSDAGTRANAARWVFHEFGDIGAQPWHAVALYTTQFPNGDDGGNKVAVDWGSDGKFDKDLHALADAGGAHPNPNDPTRTENNFKFLKEPLTPESLQWVNQKAQTILAANPKSSFTAQELGDQNPQDWVKDLAAQANKLYPEFTNNYTTGPDSPPLKLAPNDPRLAEMEHVMDRNVALAAYRLAAWCDKVASEQAVGMALPHGMAAAAQAPLAAAMREPQA
jgi:hypothetical protein